MSPFYPTTGWFPLESGKCARCGNPKDGMYKLCQDCRDTDLILEAAAKIVAEREALLNAPDLDPMEGEGYESPYQIRSSLGL
jgi:hypothetical protein